MMRTSYVYHLTDHTILCIGVINDLNRRATEHRVGIHEAFTRKYNVNKRAHFETYSDINAAIAREKQLKAGLRA